MCAGGARGCARPVSPHAGAAPCASLCPVQARDSALERVAPVPHPKGTTAKHDSEHVY